MSDVLFIPNDVNILTCTYSGNGGRYTVRPIGDECSVRAPSCVEDCRIVYSDGRPGRKSYARDYASSNPRDDVMIRYAREELKMESPKIIHEAWQRDRYYYVVVDLKVVAFKELD